MQWRPLARSEMHDRREHIKATIRPDQNRESVLTEIDHIAHDEAELAALELWVARVGAPPPVKVTTEDGDRLFADEEGKGALRVMNERVDAAR